MHIAFFPLNLLQLDLNEHWFCFTSNADGCHCGGFHEMPHHNMSSGTRSHTTGMNRNLNPVAKPCCKWSKQPGLMGVLPVEILIVCFKQYDFVVLNTGVE